MKICVVSQQANKIISGIGLHTKNLMAALKQDGHEVFLIVPQSERPAWHHPDHVILTPDPFWKRNQARWFPLSWYFAETLRKAHHSHLFDLVHFTDAREAFFCPAVAPMIGNINDTYAANLKSLSYYRRYYQDSLKRWLYYLLVRQAEKRTYPRFDGLLANSRYTADTITRCYPVRAERLHVCHKSISDERFILNGNDAERSSVRCILFVGTNMQRKGLGTLLRSARLLKERYPGIEYWVVGDDPNLPYFKELSVDLGIDQRFHFLGWKSQEELKKIYQAADVFVMPSLDEAFGVVLLEAMAAGQVVIGSNVGGIPEIINHLKNGLLVEPDNPRHLADALESLITNTALVKELSRGGYETAKKFTVDSMMQCTYRVYEIILSNRRTNPIA